MTFIYVVLKIPYVVVATDIDNSTLTWLLIIKPVAFVYVSIFVKHCAPSLSDSGANKPLPNVNVSIWIRNLVSLLSLAVMLFLLYGVVLVGAQFNL